MPQFDGETYDEKLDGARLARQLDLVRDYMLDLPRGRFVTLNEIARSTGFPEASISARLRDLRKTRFGRYLVLRRRREDSPGTFEYSVVAPGPREPEQLSIVWGIGEDQGRPSPPF
jgi:hypothetical protein